MIILVGHMVVLNKELVRVLELLHLIRGFYQFYDLQMLLGLVFYLLQILLLFFVVAVHGLILILLLQLDQKLVFL